MKVVYVDNNATSRVAPEVLEAMLPYFKEYYGNPSSMHMFGGQVATKVNEARELKVADVLGADPSEIIFTSCGTESDNAAILGSLDSYPEKRHLITTRVEHPAINNLCAYGRKGYRITELSVDREGRLDLDEMREAIN